MFNELPPLTPPKEGDKISSFGGMKRGLKIK